MSAMLAVMVGMTAGVVVEVDTVAVVAVLAEVWLRLW